MTREIKDSPLKNLLDNSVIFVLKFSRMQSKRSTSMEGVETQADKSMLHLSKDLLDSEELRAIQTYDYETMRWMRRRFDRPALLEGGCYLANMSTVQETYDYLDSRAEGRHPLIKKFKSVYPEKIKEAKKRLKDKFNAEEYPAVSAIDAVFDMRYNVVNWETPKKLTTISKKLYEREMKKVEAELRTVVSDIEQGIVAGFRGEVSKLLDKMTGGDDGQPKRLRKDALSHADAFFELLQKKNLTGNVELTELLDKARKVVSGVDVKTLKTDKDARSEIVKDLGTVGDKLSNMFEAAPKRRMSLKDEEV